MIGQVLPLSAGATPLAAKSAPRPLRVGQIRAAGGPGSFWAALARHLRRWGPASPELEALFGPENPIHTVSSEVALDRIRIDRTHIVGSIDPVNPVYIYKVEQIGLGGIADGDSHQPRSALAQHFAAATMVPVTLELLPLTVHPSALANRFRDAGRRRGGRITIVGDWFRCG